MQAARLTTPKNLFYFAVAIATLFVLYNNERFFLHDRTDPEWVHLRPVGNWIFLHGIPGAIALLSAPIQFSSRIRNRYPVFHRTTGYVYFVSVLIAAPLGMYVARLLSSNPVSYTISWVHGGCWLLCTLIAIKLVRNRDITRHREWMMRSYSWALIFLTARIAIRVIHPTDPNTIDAIVWITMGTAMLWPQLIINWRQIFPKRKTQAVPIGRTAVAAGD
ncbi:MAG: DUF2306 domain-containing protein [Terriglobia bacterium]|nr:DUF2306 domain-containing protein [Terriglobia bacterium]